MITTQTETTTTTTMVIIRMNSTRLRLRTNLSFWFSTGDVLEPSSKSEDEGVVAAPCELSLSLVLVTGILRVVEGVRSVTNETDVHVLSMGGSFCSAA